MRLHQKYAVLATLILLGSSYYFFGMLIPGMRPLLISRHLAGGYGYGNDLYPIWLASGELFHGRNPYAPELTRRTEIGLYGRRLDRSTPGDTAVNMRAFAYPLYTIFLLAPLAALSFPTVQVVISIVLPALAALCVFLWLRALGTNLSASGLVVAMCLSLASYPVLEGIAAGQPALLCAALIAGTVAALAKERFVLSGILLPLASIKPQLVLLIGLWLWLWAVSDWGRRKNFILSFTLTSALLLATSTWVLPSWFAGWMQMVRDYHQISPPPLAQFVLGRVPGIAVSLILVALSALLCWRARGQAAKSEGFAMCTVFVLATTALVLPSTIALYDQFLLLSGALWLYTRRDLVLRGSVPVRLLALLVMGTLMWQWLAACGLVVAACIAPAVVRAPKLLLLPLRTAASAPFALVALLCFVAVRKMKKDAETARMERLILPSSAGAVNIGGAS